MPVAEIGSLIGQYVSQGSMGEAFSHSRKHPHGQNAETLARGEDVVELSASAPKPLSAAFLTEADEAAQRLASGEGLTSDEEARIRADRVYMAVTAALALGLARSGQRPAWPGGLPAPTAEELAAANRRIHQRLLDVDLARDPSRAQEIRERAMGDLRGADFGAFAEELMGERVGAE